MKKISILKMIRNWLNGLYNEVLILLKLKELTLSEKAKRFAFKVHKHVRHKYGKKPYKVHLKQVVAIGETFITLIPEEDREIVRSAEWLHDTIEDCRVTYNDIKKLFGERISNLVYACTNEKGRNRKERANEKFYIELKQVQYADYVKSMDRAANMKNAKDEKNSMYDKYLLEMPYFIKKVYNKEYDSVFQFLKQI